MGSSSSTQFSSSSSSGACRSRAYAYKRTRPQQGKVWLVPVRPPSPAATRGTPRLLPTYPIGSEVTLQAEETKTVDANPTSKRVTPASFNKTIQVLGCSDKEVEQDAWAVLRDYDIVFIVDDSKCMAGASWLEVGDALASLVDSVAQDGAAHIDLQFISCKNFGINLKDGETVRTMFDEVSPENFTTFITEKLGQLIFEHVSKLERAREEFNTDDTIAMRIIKPVHFVVITGAFSKLTYSDGMRRAIVAAAKGLLEALEVPVTQMGIQVIQIGDGKTTDEISERVSELTITDEIEGIADTTIYHTDGPLNAEALTDMLLESVIRQRDINADTVEMN